MWAPKILLLPLKIRIFGPKTAIFCPKYAILVILGQILAFLAHFHPKNGQILPNISPFGHIGFASSFGALLVGGFGVRAVSRKTPISINFILVILKSDFFQMIA